MRIRECSVLACWLLAGWILPAAVLDAAQAEEIRDLAAGAEALMRIGGAEKGASRAFDEASAMLIQAEELLAGADLSPASQKTLNLEIEAVRDDLEDLMDFYEERFYGVFPLARLTLPTLLAEEGLVVSEQLINSPDVAAAMMATRKVAELLDEYHHPYVLFRSSPANRRLENIAAEELLRDGRSTPYTRRTLVTALSRDELAAFDRGELGPEIIGRLASSIDAVNLLVLTIGQSVDLEDAQVRKIHGQYFQPGVVIQGSPVDAPPFVRVETFDFFGSARDRRDQYRPIAMTTLILFVVALVWAALVKWSRGQPFRVYSRLVVGAILFLFGRFYSVVVIVVMRRFIPEASALARAAWWWPALLGALVLLGGGLIAWIGQARLTDIMPGSRGARAVGTIFALVALGASSHFVAPLFILDPGRGLANFLPFLLAALSLAMLFAFAARTGPPVPHYFSIGPVLVAPLVGIALMKASPGLLWITVVLSAVLCGVAGIRHRVAVVRGTEETEPDPEAAAAADREKLMKLDSQISKKI